MRLSIPLFAMLMVRPTGGGCHAPVHVAHDSTRSASGRIGVAGHPGREGVLVDAIGIGAPADGAIEPGEVILAVDGVDLAGPYGFEELRERARGVPGTLVELVVADDAGATRTVLLTRAHVDDDVRRRIGRVEPVPTIWAAEP